MAIHQKIREDLHKIIDQVENPKVLEAVYVLLERELSIQVEAELSDAHKKILNERLEAYKSNPQGNLNWDDVKKEMDNEL